MCLQCFDAVGWAAVLDNNNNDNNNNLISITSICSGFVVQCTDAAAMVVDNVK